MRHVLIDTDMGCDDIIAICLLLASDTIVVDGICLVEGVSRLGPAVSNLGRVLLAMGRTDVHIGVGHPRPAGHRFNFPPRLRHEAETLSVLASLESPARTPTIGALELLATWLESASEKTMVCLGPLSNISAFIARDGTSHLEQASQLIVVGGAFFGPGNVRTPAAAAPVAEYNFYVDARAADLVLSSGWVDLVVGMDAARHVPRSALPAHLVAPAATSRAGRIALAILNEARGIDLLYDPLAAALAVDSSILTQSVGAMVRVDTDPTSPRYGVSRRVGEGRTRVATGIDVAKFCAVFASLTGAST